MFLFLVYILSLCEAFGGAYINIHTWHHKTALDDKKVEIPKTMPRIFKSVVRATRSSGSRLVRGLDDTPAPKKLISARGRMTKAGKDAADQGETEYQELVASMEGKLHLSKGRPSAVKARLKMSPKKKKQTQTKTKKRCSPRQKVDSKQKEKEKEEEEEEEKEKKEEEEKEEKEEKEEEEKEEKEEKEMEEKEMEEEEDETEQEEEETEEEAQERQHERKQRSSSPLLASLARRYRKNHLIAKRWPVPGELPTGEYVPEQIMCHSGDSVLVGWVGYNEPPTWEHVSGMPDATVRLYERQGKVSLATYCKVLDYYY